MSASNATMASGSPRCAASTTAPNAALSAFFRLESPADRRLLGRLRLRELAFQFLHATHANEELIDFERHQDSEATRTLAMLFFSARLHRGGRQDPA